MNSRSELRLDDIRAYLVNAKQKGNHITADCPLCGKKQHLHIDEKNGKLLVYCQRCNAPGSEFFKEWRRMGARPAEAAQIDYRTTAPVEDYRHVYRNPDGTEAYYKRRRKWSNGHKVFSFAYVDANGRTVYTKPEGCNNLYNLDLMAQHEQETLYIVEGEKCADAMVAHGLLATTANTGAQKNIKLSDTDRELLLSYPVRIVIPDNDDKGSDYAAAWDGAVVLPIANIWPECPPKGDVADYFAAGGSADKIVGYQFKASISLDDEYISRLSAKDLISEELMAAMFSITDAFKRDSILAKVKIRARELFAKREFETCWRSYLNKKSSEGIRSDNMTKFPTQPFEMRCGQWMTGSTGVYRQVQVNNDVRNEYASPIPIMPTEIVCNVEDDTEKVRLSYFKDGRWRSLIVPRSRVANKNKILDLADFGIEVNSDNAALLVKYLAEAIALNPDILPRSKGIDHLGWAGNVFVPYTEDIKLDCEDQYKSLVTSVTEAGTLEEWVEYIAPLRKNLFLRLIMAASFASVLVEKVRALPFVLHLWGGTGSGKTVAAMVAASIWGNPGFGHLVRTMNMTINSMMNSAAILRNLPFIGDELQTIKSRFENYDTLIMRVTEGIDRGRMTNATLQRQKTWANSFIFTGEEPCTVNSSGGGVKNRVIEIECDEKIIEDGNAVVNFISSHYGCAGRAFIEALKLEKLGQDHQEIQRLVMEIADTTDKQAATMALMLQADAIATRHIFKSNDILTPADVVDFVKSKSEVDAAERAYRLTLDLIAENRNRFDGVTYDEAALNACWGKKQSDGTVMVIKSVLERELGKLGFSFDAVKKKWADRGFILKTAQGRYTEKASVLGTANYCVRLKL